MPDRQCTTAPVGSVAVEALQLLTFGAAAPVFLLDIAKEPDPRTKHHDERWCNPPGLGHDTLLTQYLAVLDKCIDRNPSFVTQPNRRHIRLVTPSVGT